MQVDACLTLMCPPIGPARAHQATLHMRRKLSEPRSVWLTSSSTASGRVQHLEAVERGSSMADMMQLLAVRGLAGG